MANSQRRYPKLLALITLMATVVTATVVGVVSPVGEQRAEAAPLVPLEAVGDSPDKWIRVEVVANPMQVPMGGGDVTFTYRVTNTKPAVRPTNPDSSLNWMFFDSINSNVCNNAVPTANSQLKNHPVMRESYLRAGETAEWTCTTTITQDASNTFSASFYDYYGNYDGRRSKASATETVTVIGGPNCNGLWYSSGALSGSTGTRHGSIGTIDLANYVLTNRRTINFTDTVGTPAQNYLMNGSPAVAVDPSDPNKIYYVPRVGSGTSHFGGLWLYDATTGTNRRVADHNTPDTVRLGVTTDGSIWSVGQDGVLQKFDGTSWTSYGRVTLPPISGKSYTFNAQNTPRNYEALGSGDLAFDGLGNMWLIGSDRTTQNAYLFTVSKADILDGGGITATLVGQMGRGEFNGIAFGPDGKLYGTARDINVSGSGTLYEINKTTGQTKFLKNFPNDRLEDLGSCSLPKPVLQVTKTADPVGAVREGDTITYTIEIKNSGNLEATGVNFTDDLSGQFLDYVPGSSTLNGSAWTDVGGRAPFQGSKAEVKSPSAAQNGTVAPGESAIITFKVKPKPGQIEVCNSGTVNFTGNPSVNGVLTDDPSKPNPADPTCNQIFYPQIGLDKKGLDPESGEPKTVATPGGNKVRYVYYVSTNPNQPKGMAPERKDGLLVEGPAPDPSKEPRIGNESLKDIKVTDDRCADIRPVTTTVETKTFNVGDRNGDGLLDPSETWEYECAQDVSLSVSTTNKATVTATSVASNTALSDQDTWTVEPLSFKVEKNAKVTSDTGETWAPQGSTIKVDADGNTTAVYRVTVTNTGIVEQPHPAFADYFTPPTGMTIKGISLAPVNADGTVGTATTWQGDAGTYTIPKSVSSLKRGASQSYQIVVDINVADFTKVDWKAVGQCETSGQGDPTKGLFNKVDLENDTDGPDNNDACIPVDREIAKLTLVKKIAEPNYDPDANVNQWILTADNPKAKTPNDVKGTTGDAKVTAREVSPGTYTLTEELTEQSKFKAAGYKQDSLVCVDVADRRTPVALQDKNQLTLNDGQEVECTFTNSTLPASLTWKKVDADDTSQALKGSEWTLIGPSYVDGVTIGKDHEQSSGTFTVSGLKWGEYTLTEFKAPAGYVRDVTDHKRVVGPVQGGEPVFVTDFGTITNAKKVPPTIPLTGGISRDFYAALGAVVTLIGVGWAVVNRKLIARKGDV